MATTKRSPRRDGQSYPRDPRRKSVENLPSARSSIRHRDRGYRKHPTAPIVVASPGTTVENVARAIRARCPCGGCQSRFQEGWWGRQRQDARPSGRSQGQGEPLATPFAAEKAGTHCFGRHDGLVRSPISSTRQGN